MPDSQYGNSQTPSSRPPEPPYRSSSTSTQPYFATHADTSGIDRTGEVPMTSRYEPVGSNYATESFASARQGDTATMPNASQDAYAPNAHNAQGGYQSQPAHQYMASAPAKQKSGAGKTFLAGFLGALVACALAFGGFMLWSGGNMRGTVASSTIGSTDQSVINAIDEGQTLAEAVAAKALPSVVAVYNYQKPTASYGYGFGFGYGSNSGSESSEPEYAGMGSGVVISNDGYIITNYHVVDDADKVTVVVDGIERDAEYVGGDSSSDIAVVKVSDTSGLVAADIGDSDSLAIGEWVMTIGAPLGLEQSVATGVVSATNRSTIMDNSSSSNAYGFGYYTSTPEYTYYPNMIQTDAVINPGNSGGALVDADGKLIGINSMFSSYSGSYAGVGFAIPINYAIGIAEDIMAGKEPTHAILGVSISQVNSQTAQRYNLSATSGAYIADIYDNTGAADSDLQVGDIITAINGKTISSTTDVTLDVRAYSVGDTVTVTVNRNGEKLDIPVVLSSDENMSSSGGQSTQQNPFGNGEGNGFGNGFGDGYGFGEGDGNGGDSDDLTMDELEYLLQLLGR